MQKTHRFRFILLGMLSLTIAACGYRGRDARRAETPLEPAWPRPNNVFRQASYSEIRVGLPTIEGAEFVNDDELCLTCHKVYTESFADNVHRGIHTEASPARPATVRPAGTWRRGAKSRDWS